MGLIKAVAQAVGGSFADQWLEVIEPDDMGDQSVFTRGVLIRRGQNTKELMIPYLMVPSSMYMIISL